MAAVPRVIVSSEMSDAAALHSEDDMNQDGLRRSLTLLSDQRPPAAGGQFALPDKWTFQSDSGASVFHL